MPINGTTSTAAKRTSKAWDEVDKDRGRYYKARADKIELENKLARGEYVDAIDIKTEMTEFCRMLRQKILQSELPANLQDELLDDIGDYLKKKSLSLPDLRQSSKHRNV
jgi:hypothetical protein